MVECLERKVFLFDPKTTPPTEDDSFNGYILALDNAGIWMAETVYWVRLCPEDFRAWMQYPGLSKHIEVFSEKGE